MESEFMFNQNETINPSMGAIEHFENNEFPLNDGDKRKCKKKSTRKTKPSPVMKVDEETIVNSSISDNGMNTPVEFEGVYQNDILNSSSSREDESMLIHLVLSKILDKKKMELLDNEELRCLLTNKGLNKM